MKTEAVDTSNKNNTFLQMLPGLLVTVVALVILAYLVDFEQFIKHIQKADFSTFPYVLLLFMATIVFRAVAWRTILQEKVTWSKSFWTLNEGYMLNNVLPFRLGEIGRAVLLSGTTPLSFWEVLSTIMVERIFDIALLAGLLLTTVPLVVGAEWAMQAAIGAGILVIVGIGFLFAMARKPRIAQDLIRIVTKPWPKLTEFGLEKLDAFLPGLSALTEISRFLKVAFWMILTWVTNISWYAVLLYAFVPDAEPLWAAFSVGVVALGVSAPSSPGYIGVFEAATVGALTLFGVESSQALAYGVVSHSLYLVITILFGGIGLARDGQSISKVYERIRNRPKEN